MAAILMAFMISLYIFVVFVFAFIAIRSEMTNPHFIIHKGKRKSDNLFTKPYLFKTSFMFKIQISSSAWYQLENDDYIDTNKLCGVQVGLNKYDTYQVGWLPDYYHKGQFWLYINYYGPNNRSEFMIIDTISYEDIYYIKFRILDDKIIVTASNADNKQEYRLNISQKFSYKSEGFLRQIGFQKSPKHGSSSVSPHTYRVYVEQMI
jgi:hypothetical protein